MKIDKGTYRILVVEDNPGDYLLVKDYLLEYIQQPQLTHVKNFTDARALLNKENASFDIVLLDLSLPDITREALIQETRAFSKNIPVIVLTGYADIDFSATSLSLGISDYLIKDVITPLVLYKSILYTLKRHRYLASLRDSEKRYMDLFHLSPSPLWVYEIDTLAFLDVNEAAIRHYGFSKEEFLSMTLKDIRPQEDIPLLETAISEIKNKTSAYYKNVFRHKKKDGAIIHVEIRSNLIDYNGKKAEIVLATDITEKIIQIQAIEAQNKKLREIAWTQSHVVRAPVARLMGLIDLMKNGNLEASEKAEMFNHVFSSVEEIDAIIKEIVDKSQEVIDVVNK